MSVDQKDQQVNQFFFHGTLGGLFWYTMVNVEHEEVCAGLEGGLGGKGGHEATQREPWCGSSRRVQGREKGCGSSMPYVRGQWRVRVFVL